jgi:uracil-DNA glycosylase
MDVNTVNISPEWKLALKSEFEKPYFDEIRASLKADLTLGKTIFPPGKLIFNAFDSCPPNDIKVVIIGQDPYHNPDEAMGLSFSVPKSIKIPPSLKNIYKELVNDVGIDQPTHGDLTSWAKQGVFLLNAILTVEMKQAGSHKNLGWQEFTDQTIKYISDNCKNVVFMLWGNFAKNKKVLIDVNNHLVLESAHPSPLAGNAFQGNNHFSKANAYLVTHGKSPIDWQIY